MATVYLAEDLKHHRQVAVKVLRPDITASLGAQRFLREIEIAARLQHPHILPLLDSGEADGFLFYVMPYVEGESLRDKLTREHELPVADAVRILHDIVDALSYAHQHGVVHRDVKPENVLLSGRHAMVADFGIAKAVSDATGAHSLTTVGVALGTPAYMSPEQATADVSVDARADIYAVGAVAFEILTGRPPFEGQTPQAVLAAHVTRAPVPLTALRPQVPANLATLVMRCLEKRPADRWQKAEEMLPVLEGVLTLSGGMTPVEPPTGVGSRNASKRRLIAASSVAVTFALLIGALFVFRARRAVEPTNLRVVVVPPDNRTGNAALDHLEVTSGYWMSRAIGSTNMLEVVPAGTAHQLKSALEAKPSSEVVGLPRRVAIESGAGLVVSGAYLPAAGDSVRFELQLTDARSDRLLTSINPVTISTTDLMTGLVVLGRRVAAAVAQRVDHKVHGQAKFSAPPSSYDAYRSFADASQAAPADFRETERLARKSLALDSSFQSARVMLSLALLNLGKYAESDSILHIVEADPSGLSPAERAVTEWTRGSLAGDHATMYRSAKRMVEVEPSMTMLWILGFETARDNRPREALEIMERVDPRSIQMDGNPMFWESKTDAQHMIVRHDLELTSARAARRQYPANLCTLYYEAVALAALKRTTEAEQLLHLSADLQPLPCVTPGVLAREVALEMRVHGDSTGARRAIAWAVHWYELLPRSQQLAQRRDYAEALYAAERWSDAGRVLNDVCRETLSALDCLGLSGAIAARLGERAKAKQIAEQIAGLPYYPPRLEGDALLLRSYIAAVLGEKELAVALLRQSMGKGIYYSSILHRQADLQLLRGYAAFDELLRPKG